VLVAVGLNRTLATAADRDHLAWLDEEMIPVLAGDAALDGADEVAVLATGHRLEIYAAARFPGPAAAALRSTLERRASEAGRALPLFELHGDEALRHLIRVAGGLDSALLGEPRILSAVRSAFEHAAASGAAGPALAEVCRQVCGAVGRIRAETSLGLLGGSWGSAAASLAEKVLGPLSGRRLLLLGRGPVPDGVARHLAGLGAARTTALADADLVVSAVDQPPAWLQPEPLARLLRARRRPIVLVDLAVPRALERSLGDLDGAYLCDTEDLERVMRASQAERAEAVRAAERIVDAEVSRAHGLAAAVGPASRGARPEGSPWGASRPAPAAAESSQP
jgi:glutamyl-tRNA reductase